MKPFKNLREFVESWPQGITVITQNTAERCKDFSELTTEEKWQYADHGWYLLNQVEVSHKENNWYMYRRSVEVNRRGRSFYPKTQLLMLMSIVEGKLSIRDITWSHICDLRSRYAWLSQILSSRFGRTITNKTLLKEVLLGNITNSEDYYKWILKHTYRIDSIPWKLFREYGTSTMRISIFDLIEATTNPKLALETWLNARGRSEWMFSNLLEDSILTALRLGEKINPQWSQKRLSAEHQKHIERIQFRRIEAMANTPASHILDNFDFPEGVKWLNTEVEVFKEASHMHHCLHSNYWRYIKKGAYVAFAVDRNGEHFTLGCNFNGNFCTYDQAHTIYNGSVSTANRVWINDFIHDLGMFLGRSREETDFAFDEFISDYGLPY